LLFVGYNLYKYFAESEIFNNNNINKRERKMATFAIFQTGGKQYRVSEGDIVKVEKLNATGEVSFDQVLMVADKVGNPFVEGAKVVAEVVEQTRDDKVLVFKKKRRQNYRRTAGHRQFITVLKIKSIKA
jgi:large subunit ribosomal protein L21